MFALSRRLTTSSWRRRTDGLQRTRMGLTMPDGSNVVLLKQPVAAAETEDFITVLTTVDGKLLTKKFYIDEDGKLALQDYDNAKWYSVEQRPATNLNELYELL